MPPTASQLGSDDYREGALLRLSEAQLLRDEESWIGAIYLAGRAVEAILRSLLWAQDRRQEVGHDLPELLARVRSLVNLSGDDDESLARLDNAVNEIAVVWRNDLRFTGERRFRRLLRANGRMYRIGNVRVKGDPVKANARKALEACEAVVTRGEPLCKRYRKESSR